MSLLRVFELWRLLSTIIGVRHNDALSGVLTLELLVRLCQLKYKTLLDLELAPCLFNLFGHCSDLIEVVGLRIAGLDAASSRVTSSNSRSLSVARSLQNVMHFLSELDLLQS